MSNPLITIIIPIYNIENYISDCLHSVLAQTYRNLEIICVNDGSTDASAKIVYQLMSEDSRIKIIEKENGGLSDARNAGIDNAHGDFLFFLDGDDCIAQHCIEKLVELALTYDSDISICQFETFFEGKYFEKSSNPLNDLTMDGCQLYKLSYLDKKMKITLNTAWGKLYARKLFLKARYPKGIINEDEYLTYKLFLEATSVSLTHRPLYGYRQRPGSIMHASSKDPEHLFALANVFESRIIEFSKSGSCDFLDLIIDDCLCQVSTYYCKINDRKYKSDLLKKYRRIFILYKKHLPTKIKVKRSLFYFSPPLYKTLTSLITN